MMLGFNKVSVGLKRKETASIQELHDNYFQYSVFILFHTCIRSCTQMVACAKIYFLSKVGGIN